MAAPSLSELKKLREDAAKAVLKEDVPPAPAALEQKASSPATPYQPLDLREGLEEGARALADKYRDVLEKMQEDPMFGGERVPQLGTELLRAAPELAASATPAGWAVDAKDLITALEEKNIPLGALAAAGLIPGVGDAVKAVGKKALKGVRGLAKVPEEGVKVLKEGDEARSISKVGTEDAPEAAEALQETKKKGTGDSKEVEGPRPTGIKGFNPEEFEEALDAMSDAKAVVRFVAKTAEDPSYRKIAERITPYIENTSFKVLRKGDPLPGDQGALASGRALGTYRVDGPINRWGNLTEVEPTAVIRVRSRSIGETSAGTNAETVLHELLHAATFRRLRDSYAPENAGTELVAAREELDALFKKVVPEWKKLGGTVGPPRRLDTDELVAWGYTNPKFQELLKTIKIDGKSGWNRFMEILGELLGLSPKEHNALSELIRVTERVLDAPLKDLPDRTFTKGITYDPKQVAPASLKEQTEDAAKSALEKAVGKKALKEGTEEVVEEAATAGAKTPADAKEAKHLWQTKGTASPYFKRWFGDSKIVDEGGEPIVMYHGTPREFEAFSSEYSGGLFHFTEDKHAALNYARGGGGGRRGRGWADVVDHTGARYRSEDGKTWNLVEEGHVRDPEASRTLSLNEVERGTNLGSLYAQNRDPRLVAAYLTIKNPLDARAAEGTEVIAGLSSHGNQKAAQIIREAKEELARAKSPEGRLYPKPAKLPWDTTKYEFATRAWEKVLVPQLKDLGYDGMRLSDYGHSTWAVFDPTQIKSATANRGTFDPLDPNITRGVALPALAAQKQLREPQEEPK